MPVDRGHLLGLSLLRGWYAFQHTERDMWSHEGGRFSGGTGVAPIRIIRWEVGR